MSDILRAFCAGEKLAAPTGRDRIRMLLEENRTDVGDDEAALREAYSWYGDLMRKQHQCNSCKAIFTEVDNVGWLRCNVHTGQYISVWSCCGKAQRDALGCMRQDHSTSTPPLTTLVPRFALTWLPDWQRRRICPINVEASFLCIANPGEHGLTEAELTLWRTRALSLSRQ